MSLKEWKNKEIGDLLTGKWGFKMNLGNLSEAKKKKPDADGDGVPDWADKKPGKDDHADGDEEEPIKENEGDSENKGGGEEAEEEGAGEKPKKKGKKKMSKKQEKYFGKKKGKK